MTYCIYEGCEEKVFEDSDYCILHVELPEDETSAEFKRINELKENKVQERILDNKINLKAARLLELNIENNHALSEINLIDAVIRRNFLIINCTITENIFLSGMIVGIENEEKYGQVSFREVHVGSISFVKATIYNDFFLTDVKTHDLLFTNGLISRNTQFRDCKIDSFTLFCKTRFGGLFTLDNCEMGKELSFDGSTFDKATSQEEACRNAKNIYEKQGNKEEADYYFYREMEAKRKQKKWYFRYPESLFQYCFGYGVYPLRVLSIFFGFFIIFTLIFWQISGIYMENSINIANLQISLKLSFLTLIIPAYGIVSPTTTDYGFYIIIEAILGAFMWPLFIAVFARKYMR